MSVIRIAVDATAIPPRLTGVGIYVAGLLRALSRRDDVSIEVFADPRSVEVLRPDGQFSDKRPHPDSSPAQRPWARSAVRVHAVRAAGAGRPLRIAWTQLGATRAASRVGAALLHGVHYELPLLGGGPPRVVTIHDLTFIAHPEWHDRAKVAYFRWAIPRAVRKARRVFCVSRTTARELVERLEVDAARVDVTALGTDLTPASSEAIIRFRRRLGLDAPYIASLGTLEPRKDIPSLVAAFGSIAREWPHHLVIAGLKGWGSGTWSRAVVDSEVADRIHLVGYVPEPDKAALYSGADVFVYPSRFEGFGLPVLEAMACGVPVVTTTGGALPEVAGDAAVLVAPGNIHGIANALSELLGDADERADLIERGQARAAEHTWERCAEHTVAGYRRALEEG